MNIDQDQDDFEKDKDIQEQRREQEEYEKMIEDSVKTMSELFSLEPRACTDIEHFLIFKSFDSVDIIDCFGSKNEDFPIEVYYIEYKVIVRGGKSNSIVAGECFLGLLQLKRSYPNTCIFKETMRTIVADWFNKQDVDFKDQKEFSRKFHMATADKVKLQSLLFNKPLDELAAFPEMEVELRDKNCLFKVSNSSVYEEEVKQFIELAKKLHKIFS